MSNGTATHPCFQSTKGKKYGYDNLIRFVECDPQLLSNGQKSALSRSRTTEWGFYGFLPQVFPRHYVAFRNMHDAELVRNGVFVTSDWEMTSDGFIQFIIDIGPIPGALKNPILARTHPAKGFYRGNLKWVNQDKFRSRNARRSLSFTPNHRRNGSNHQ